jgi:hypothetical protein
MPRFSTGSSVNTWGSRWSSSDRRSTAFLRDGTAATAGAVRWRENIADKMDAALQRRQQGQHLRQPLILFRQKVHSIPLCDNADAKAGAVRYM